MVTNSRKAPGPSAIRALNKPAAVQVRADAQGQPTLVFLHRRWYQVQDILETWRIDDEWWRAQPVSRMYYRAETAQSPLKKAYSHVAAEGHPPAPFLEERGRRNSMGAPSHLSTAAGAVLTHSGGQRAVGALHPSETEVSSVVVFFQDLVSGIWYRQRA